MPDEVAKVGMNEQVLGDCRVALEEQKISPERSRELLELLERSLVDDNLIETLNEKVLEEHDVWHKIIDDETLGRILRGHIFESVALGSLPDKERKYKELERFLLMSLKDPRIWYTLWRQKDLLPLSEAEKEQLEEYKRIRPSKNELSALRNNDAIAVDIKTNPETKKSVAVITGVVEAKNHRLGERNRDERQMRTALEILYNVIMRYKRSFPLLIKGLDLGPGMPDEIDILPPEKLSYTILQPADLDTDAERALTPTAFSNCHFRYAPITKQEVFILAKVVKPYIKQDM